MSCIPADGLCNVVILPADSGHAPSDGFCRNCCRTAAAVRTVSADSIVIPLDALEYHLHQGLPGRPPRTGSPDGLPGWAPRMGSLATNRSLGIASSLSE